MEPPSHGKTSSEPHTKHLRIFHGFTSNVHIGKQGNYSILLGIRLRAESEQYHVQLLLRDNREREVCQRMSCETVWVSLS